jgi:hypothetical protein
MDTFRAGYERLVFSWKSPNVTHYRATLTYTMAAAFIPRMHQIYRSSLFNAFGASSSPL